MIKLKSEKEIELIRESALLVGAALAEVAKIIKVGATTLELNNVADDFIVANGGFPAFKGYSGFPYACCISVNDAVVHGFPNSKPLQSGDIVSVDIGVLKNGYHGDSAYTFLIGDASVEVLKLLSITKKSLYAGIEKAIANNRVGDISNAIQDLTQFKNGYGVVKDLVGHGLGKDLHEPPNVPNYGKRGAGPKLQEGLVIAIEPMINLGTKDVFTDADGWTIRTKDGKPSAHYEHDVVVRKGKAEILSSFELIEIAERENTSLNHTYNDL
jgi:methionyl aminopeptidase